MNAIDKDVEIEFNDSDYKLCINCKFLDNEIKEGHLKCYWECPFKKTITLKKWL